MTKLLIILYSDRSGENLYMGGLMSQEVCSRVGGLASQVSRELGKHFPADCSREQGSISQLTVVENREAFPS